jgi:predicted nucleic acid-binding protein
MAWVVDTSVLVDVFENDPQFGRKSAQCLTKYVKEGLVICPITYIEFSPLSNGDPALLDAFLQQTGVSWVESWSRQDTVEAFGIWGQHIAAKRSGAALKRPIADVLIGAFALRFQGIITRNPKDFTRLAPNLRIIVP